jgi:hypothetical protein
MLLRVVMLLLLLGELRSMLRRRKLLLLLLGVKFNLTEEFLNRTNNMIWN